MVTAVLVIGNAGGSFVSNLALMLVCLSVGFVVHSSAPAIGALCGWRRVAANVAMTLGAAAVLLAVGRPHVLNATAAFFYECGCYFWFELCCYI